MCVVVFSVIFFRSIISSRANVQVSVQKISSIFTDQVIAVAPDLKILLL